MNNIYYKTNVAGDLITVHPVEEDLCSLRTRFRDMQTKIDSLLEENTKLKSLSYKDEELKRLDSKIKILEQQLYQNSFYVLKEDKEKAEKWAKKHSKTCKGAHYSYRFYPIPGIGCCGKIWCEKCNDYFTFCSD